MDKQVLIVSLVGGFLGLLSVILGFTAEVTKINASDVYIGLYACIYPSSPALGIAITAVLLLVVAQILVTAFSGCCGCCSKDPNAPAVTGTRKTLSIIFAVISWITFAISVILLIVGAIRNGSGGHTTTHDDCYVVKPGIFAGGAICALCATSLSIAAYILLSPPTDAASKSTGAQYGNGNIAMGIPQNPPAQPQYPAPGVGGTQYQASGVSRTQYPPPGTNYSA